MARADTPVTHGIRIHTLTGTTMRTAMMIVFVGLASITVPAAAQSSPKAGAASAKPTNFVGEWEGAYQTSHGPNGPMSMRISRDSTWKATAELVSGSQTIPSSITDVAVDGNTMTWTQEVMGMS